MMELVLGWWEHAQTRRIRFHPYGLSRSNVDGFSAFISIAVIVFHCVVTQHMQREGQLGRPWSRSSCKWPKALCRIRNVVPQMNPRLLGGRLKLQTTVRQSTHCAVLWSHQQTSSVVPLCREPSMGICHCWNTCILKSRQNNKCILLSVSACSRSSCRWIIIVIFPAWKEQVAVQCSCCTNSFFVCLPASPT